VKEALDPAMTSVELLHNPFYRMVENDVVVNAVKSATYVVAYGTVCRDKASSRSRSLSRIPKTAAMLEGRANGWMLLLVGDCVSPTYPAMHRFV